MLNKALQIIKQCHGRFRHWGVFDGIEIFLCDFYREQSWQRWVNKKSNDVFMIADNVKCRLRRIANSQTVDDCEKAIW